MHPRKIALQELLAAGYSLKRQGGNHEIYYNPQTQSIIPLKRHDFNDNDLKNLRRQIRQKERGKGS